MTLPENVIAEEQAPQSGGFGLRDPMELYYQYRFLCAGTFVLIFILGALYTFLQTPQYEATARIAVNVPMPNPIPTETAIPISRSNDIDIVDSQVEILYSGALTARVVKQLALDRDSEFSVTPDNDRASQAIAEEVIRRINIYRSGKTNLINISFRSASASKAAKIANSYAQNYLALQMEGKQAITRQANSLLAERIDEMAIAVRDAEQHVQSFKIQNELMSVNGATLAEQSIAAIDNDLARARAEERAAAGQYRSANRSGARMAAAQTPALEQLLIEKASAEQEWRQVQIQYGERHPRYGNIKARLGELDIAIANENGRARAALSARHQQALDDKRATLAAASQKRQSLLRSLGNTRRSLALTNNAQVELDALERSAAAIRTTYEVYLSRYQETTTKLGAEQPDARIISIATPPVRATSPNISANLFLAALLGLSLALALVVAMHVSGSGVRKSIEV